MVDNIEERKKHTKGKANKNKKRFLIVVESCVLVGERRSSIRDGAKKISSDSFSISISSVDE